MSNDYITLTHVLSGPDEKHKLDIEAFRYEF